MPKIADFSTDTQNANRGTERGHYALDESLRRYGAGRSIVVDRENRVIAGNKTLERAVDLGLDEVIVIETDGTKLVAVKRTDLDLAEDDGRARGLALADNRVGQLDLDWDALQVLNDLPSDAAFLWSAGEIEALQAVAEQQAREEFPFMDSVGGAVHDADNGNQMEPDANVNVPAARYPLAIVLNAIDKARWDAYKQDLGMHSDTEVLLALLSFAELHNGG